MTPPPDRRIALVILLALTVGTVAACGSSSSSSSTASAPATDAAAPGAGTTGAASDCASKSQAAVDAARAPIDVPAITPFNMKAAAGKSVWLINVTNNQLTTAIGEGFTAAAQAAGMTATVYDGKGILSTQLAGIQQAVDQRAGAIALLGVDPKLASQPLAAAIAAKIPLVDIFNGNASDPLPAGFAAHVDPDFVMDGALMADIALADSGCTATVGAFYASVLTVHNQLIAGVKNELSSLCPNCGLDVQDVDLSKLATDAALKTQTMLRKSPDINYLIPVFDSAVTFIQPAAQAVNPKIKIISHDGVPANLDNVRKGNGQIADISFPPNDWMGWALVDVMGRAITGSPTSNVTIPVQLVDKTNATTSNESLFPKYAGFQDKYKVAWGG